MFMLLIRRFLCVCAFYAVIVLVQVSVTESECQRNGDCTFGYCQAGHCICNEGWWGNSCEFCRLRLGGDHGIIYDGDGKYSLKSKCSWLVESPRPNTTITFRLNEFATECAWDHLYIYDGRSMDDPQLAVFSGLIRDKTIKSAANEPIRIVQAKSGAAFLYFYSDKHYQMNGFNITYSVTEDCDSRCRGHGRCNTTRHCICDPGWIGPKCDIPWCRQHCINGVCNPGTRICNCYAGFKGQSCSVKNNGGYWSTLISNNQDNVEGRASHASGVIGEWMWVVGGHTLRAFQSDALTVIRYNVYSNSWESVKASNLTEKEPSQRYAHSLVVYNDSLIVFGGVAGRSTVNELWSFDTKSKMWTQISLSADSDKPVALAGHTATLIGAKMVVLFGYGPSGGAAFNYQVQELDFEEKRWSAFNASGAVVIPTYGHTSVYDPHSQLIFVHGGYRLFAKQHFSSTISSELNAYNHITRHWHSLVGSGSARFLHSAVLVGNLMFVYGGNTHNGTTQEASEAKCFSADFLVYDSACQRWSRMPLQSAPKEAARYGHSALWMNSAMYVFGGFSGTMFNNILTYTPGNCSMLADKSSCLESYNSSGCVWNKVSEACVGPQEAYSLSDNAKELPSCSVSHRCEEYKQCSRCTTAPSNCLWCGYRSGCRSDKCPNPKQVAVTKLKQCKDETGLLCTRAGKGRTCLRSNCANHTSCNECIHNRDVTGCMWCGSQQKCFRSSAYVVTFPYGQCLEWTQEKCENTKCANMKTCNDCHTLPGCGWCDDGSGTGLGQCMEGGDSGPRARTTNSTLNKCSRRSWYFIECPPCQCNGHSTCINNNICKACRHQTEGPHCEKCTTGYFGDAKNGGSCTPCQCNEQAKTCNHVSGKCNCMTKGVGGARCDRCQTKKGFVGNVTSGGNCYYRLYYNYHFTFNVTGKSRINFISKPTKDDRDVTFSIEITSGGTALMNVTDGKSDVIIAEEKIGSYETTFSHNDYKFGESNGVEFHVYVFGINRNIILKISFSQPSPYLDLLKFFITFFGCFFSLLFLATVAWKIKLRYVSYVLSRQRLEEVAQMASRPFATVPLLLPNSKDTPKKSLPNPIATEPCSTKGAAVATVLVKLPSQEDGYTPVGQSGLCCAATLIKYGHGCSSNSSSDTRRTRRKSSKPSGISSTC